MPLWSKRQAEEELPPFPVQLKNGVLTAELLDWYIAAASAVLSTSNVALSPQRPVTAIREALKLAP